MGFLIFKFLIHRSLINFFLQIGNLKQFKIEEK